jgi:hypothetical protein
MEAPDEDRVEHRDDADIAVDRQMPEHQGQELAVPEEIPQRNEYEGKPGWFSLIARAAQPQALLPFRYIEGT